MQLEVRLSVVLCGVFGYVEETCEEEWMCFEKVVSFVYRM